MSLRVGNRSVLLKEGEEMIAYFVRRVMGGFVQLLAGTLFIFYIVLELPVTSTTDGHCTTCSLVPPKEYVQFIEKGKRSE